MAQQDSRSLASDLLKTRTALVAVTFTLVGWALTIFNNSITGADLGMWNWLHGAALGDIGGTFIAAGVIGSIMDYSARRAQAANAVAQYAEVNRQQIPEIRDAVLEAFAIKPADLKRVATPELLDDIAANAMGLRLGDEQFAREIYSEIRDQAIRAAERWHDVEVRIRLSSALESSTSGAALFDVTVEWEYTTVPSGSVRRFACVSDRDEYNDLLLDIPATSPWFMKPRPGMDASSRESYELLELTVDGRPQPIRRTVRKEGQTYSVHLDAGARTGEPVRIRQVFRTVTPVWGHRLYFELPQPARNMTVSFDYTNTNIVDMRVIESVATTRPTQLSRSPEHTNGKTISVEAVGWLMPKAGFTFTWTVDTELPHDDRQHEAA
ncbi:hypothetical protein Gbro_1447 [Gordonia bronchialis DSM 43247]|uniref:Uncharacterized protein n=1 Tax=Gordonia bronchialis (strain ATCC 25592 / DSM 43247 / BCRC 13721 / JCM 3198 / KCTC 3076 / NBRC 16047 / NCTC 10667) TaxID=526226 RepID=D0L6H1_GORB4|nr:hypothetical protein [Gordonia bronchialis]ACY20728.1 hypothetical protein Gbro_1447 [Gordonia bronchialis DSM 43247]MCC3323503.1 hypothetical protein [Gordonia bronchialis]QGS25520.1 hypothetical protein FOB84_16635 [Gordonia bronchialis]STQ63559.1 Uncharacterised protein [Gordonia bronchialis]